MVTPYNTSIVADIPLDLPVGSYVVAVSGGVDSVVLLDLLTKMDHLKLVVAHFDHGIRQDSADDELFVSKLATIYGLPYVSVRMELGKQASEATARDARYAFLRDIAQKHGAEKIITAHHQDDLLETMILNLLRGTGRRGLDPLLSSQDILRPLLPFSKEELMDYAISWELKWREDPTNTDVKFRRNKVRHEMMPKLWPVRPTLLGLNADARRRNKEIDDLLEGLDTYLLNEKGDLVRQRFVTLPHKVASEYLHRWLIKNSVKNIDSNVVNRATIAAKTLAPCKKIDLKNGYLLQSEATSLNIFRNDQGRPV